MDQPGFLREVERATLLSLMEMANFQFAIEGVATRKVKDFTEVLCGFPGVAENAPSFSNCTVSRLKGLLDAAPDREWACNSAGRWWSAGAL